MLYPSIKIIKQARIGINCQDLKKIIYFLRILLFSKEKCYSPCPDRWVLMKKNSKQKPALSIPPKIFIGTSMRITYETRKFRDFCVFLFVHYVVLTSQKHVVFRVRGFFLFEIEITP